MRRPRVPAIWHGLAAGLIWLTFAILATNALGQERNKPATGESSAKAEVPPKPPIPFAQLPPKVRESVRKVVEEPTLTARGPFEAFRGQPALYSWLLDHPDRAAAEWRRLGYPCVEITERGPNLHGWNDHAGSDLQWQTVHSSPVLRIWFAEGAVRPGPLMPAVPVRAVVILHHGERRDSAGRTWLHQQADLFIHTDSKTAAAIAKLLGPAAPKAAEQCVIQLQTFFSALVRVMDRRAGQTPSSLSPAVPSKQ